MLEDHPNNYLTETPSHHTPGVIFNFSKKLKLIGLEIAFTKERTFTGRRRERWCCRKQHKQCKTRGCGEILYKPMTLLTLFPQVKISHNAEHKIFTW